ncbi:uncharacterized protein LOC143917567 isoform X2 [Arctopsyche grandis]|uniref:uncharacterized protein LOC143917567 isoform X2 n=1 Tax=Arctopsyche grandis TaxID=121162 RepID=UPI00406D6C88
MEASGAASPSENESPQSTSAVPDFTANDAINIFNNIKIEQGDISGEIDESLVTILPECTTELLEGNQISMNPVQQAVYRTIQTCRVSNPNSITKQVAIAPRPVSLVKKITLSNIRPKTISGTDISSRQMVVLPGGSNQLKLIKTGTGNQASIGQLVAVQSPSGGQVLQLRQTTNIPPLTKLTVVQDGESKTGTVQKQVPRYISLQQAQEMGLVPCGKLNPLVVSPVKQNPNLSPTMRPTTIRHIIPTIKSPTKILPAPLQGGAVNTGKVIVASLPQNFVIKSSGNSKPGQVLKMEGLSGSANTILANFPPGQKITSQQIHQLNMPGKGLQLVRLVPTSSATQQQKLGTSPIRIAPTPTSRVLQTSSKLVSTKSPIVGKTLMIDIHGNVVQMPQSSAQTTATGTVNISTIKKVISKPVINKSIPVSMSMTSSIQRICPPTTPSFTITTIPATQKTPTKEDNLEMKKSNIEMQVQKTEIIEEEVVESDDIGEGSYLDGSHQLIKSPRLSMASDMKHVVLVPPHMIPGMGDQNINSKSLSFTSEMRQSSDLKNLEPYMSPWPALEFGMRPRKPCNCTKSQCLKLYCDCFANGEFCNQCNCNNCYNNLENEEYRQKAIRTCLERNPNAFRPKIGKARKYGLEVIRRHNKGCNCKRSGCLKNYCECYEGKIACSANCKCIGCRNIEDSYDKKSLRRAKSEVVMKRLGVDDLDDLKDNVSDSERNSYFSRTASGTPQSKRPSTYMTNDVIDAVCVCLMAQAADAESIEGPNSAGATRHVLEEFARCLQDLISLTPIVAPSSIPDDTRGSSS